MTEVLIHRFATADETAIAAADAGISRVLDELRNNEVVHIGITGGTVGIKTLAVWAAHARRDEIDYSRVHIWWGDERFVASDSPDRNFVQAWDALLQHIDIPRENLHEFPSSDNGLTLDEGARIFAEHFAAVAPKIVFAFMGMGPDGHIASLFPGKPLPAAGVDVIAEHDSPKPPPARLSLSYEAINRIDEVWFTVAGADKADAVEVAFSNTPDALPVGRVHGAKRNVWFIDEAAATKI